MTEIREVPYNQPGVTVLGIETLSLAELKRRAGLENLSDVQRIQFFLLLLFTEGEGRHMVDFVTYPIRPNTLMLVKSGQVQQFSLNPTLAGQLIVIHPSFLLSERTESDDLAFSHWWSPCTDLRDDLARRFLSIAADIQADSKQYANRAARGTLLQHQLYTLLTLLRLFTAGHTSAPSSGKADILVHQFKQRLESELFVHRSVSFYAEHLGCAEKTLTRACLAVAGRTAKGILNERILLEAKRLLMQRHDSVADVGQRLGFSETTNFIRFFKKSELMTPARFRDLYIRPDHANRIIYSPNVPKELISLSEVKIRRKK